MNMVVYVRVRRVCAESVLLQVLRNDKGTHLALASDGGRRCLLFML